MSATTNQSSLVYSCVAPHPPIMVAEVGREAIAAVRSSINAMAELTKRLIASGAETAVLISPHAPLEADSFVAYGRPQLHGDFSNFGAPETNFNVAVDEELLEAITECARQQDCKVETLPDYSADHGTAVPLYFLLRNGWQGKVVALGYSFLSDTAHLRFGESIRKAIDQVGRSAAFIASGDLSHRLSPQAPAGYSPGAYVFDEEVVAALRANDPERIVNIDQSLRRLAGECGYRSVLVAIGAGSQSAPACEVLSYEAPFGVGYLVAQLTSQTREQEAHTGSDIRSTDRRDEVLLPGLARSAVETFVREGTPPNAPRDPSGLLAARAPCFVSLKTEAGDLRGCIGTIEPAKDTLAEEIIANALSAATRDPRFLPVTESELSHLRYSVDVLQAPELAQIEDLDPAVYGVIVEDESGSRRGLLLPDIAGVQSSRQQVEIAARKAGILPGAPLRLWRFKVERFTEVSQQV